MGDDRHARISEHAYRLWQQEGEPHGRDQAHWDEAERAFAGEGPIADEPDPQDGDPQSATQDASGDAAPFAAPEQPAGAAAAPSETPAPAPAASKPVDAKPAAAKKPATRRKRTT
ncbi:DUF2934 domain-containing protein [Sphingomonas phyllosphaerae]|uniref:DUF2934 domain-containing protein n=1 Tax=Sphingomonas phyllosphaerae TaxID=257003 RepID=UPI00040C4854|nr:DUF2934 domain-containing protein [Sphingomonas phyllosphaerae]